MILPSKLFSYNESSLSKMIIILKNLEDGEEKNPVELFNEISNQMNVIDYIYGLDCAYALNKIELNDDGRLMLCS